jgi:hypothetical protein
MKSVDFEIISAFSGVFIFFIFLFLALRSAKKKRKEREKSEEKYPQILFPEDYCPHEKQEGLIFVKVLGHSVEIKDSPYCKECIEKFLNENSTICTHCEKPIYPGEPVGASGIKKNLYTHLTFKCCRSGGLWCGTWGLGKLIKIEETHDMKESGETSGGIGIVCVTPKSY